MNPSRKNGRERSVSDVHATTKHETKRHNVVKNLIYGKNVINLRPNFRFRHPWILGVIILGVMLVAFFGFKNLFTRGEVKDFTATTCLGSWENPGAAEGIAETTLDASSSFSADNSAVYDASGTQIYCGGFLPSDFSTSGTLNSVTLNLVWQVGDTPYAPTSTIDISTSTDTVISTSTDDDVSSTDESSSSSDSTASSSDDSSSSASFLPLKSFFAGFIKQAFAQDDTDSDTSTPTPVPTPAPTPDTTVDSSSAVSDDTSTIILGPPLIDNLDSTSSVEASSEDDTPTGTDAGANVIIIPTSTEPTSTLPVIAPPPAPDENFLEVSYSTDGQLWIQLAEVNIENWPNMTVALPISNWDDLRNLQIKVQGIPSTQDPIPPVYLDGMIVEAHYDVAPDQPQATSTYSQFLTDQSTYTIGQPINIVGAPPDSFIEIYELDNPGLPDSAANVFAAQINNLGTTVIDSTSLTSGNYILVNTFEPAACNEYSIVQCEARDDYIDQVPITVTESAPSD